MLSISIEDLERYTKPLCTDARYAIKLENFRRVERSFLSRDEYCDGFPIDLHIEATANCNLPCPFCPRGRDLIDRHGHLSFEKFERVFSVLSPTLASLMISGWGEPLLNIETTRMIKLATESSVPVFLNSNGTVLEERVAAILDSGLGVINVALDGAVSQNTHAYTKTFPFRSVVQGVKALVKAKRRGGYQRPLIRAKIILAHENADEIEELQNWALQLGVDEVIFKRKFETMPSEFQRSEIYSVRKLKQTQQHQLFNSTEDVEFSPLGCSHPWDAIFLDGTGRLGLCSWDPFQAIDFGELTGDFEETWNGEALRMVRRWHTGQTCVGKPCAQCNRLPGYLRKATTTA